MGAWTSTHIWPTGKMTEIQKHAWKIFFGKRMWYIWLFDMNFGCQQNSPSCYAEWSKDQKIYSVWNSVKMCQWIRHEENNEMKHALWIRIDAQPTESLQQWENHQENIYFPLDYVLMPRCASPLWLLVGSFLFRYNCNTCFVAVWIRIFIFTAMHVQYILQISKM